MSSKKKLIVSLSVAAAVLVAAVIAIVAVFAAASQAATSQINVTFKAKNVDCVVAGSYSISGAEAVTIGQVEFDSAEATTSKALTPKDVVIEDTRSNVDDDVYLDLIYTFTNLASSNLEISIPTITVDNVVISYIVDEEEVDTFTNLVINGGDSTTHTIVVRATLTDAILNSAEDVEFAINATFNLSAAYAS